MDDAFDLCTPLSPNDTDLLLSILAGASVLSICKQIALSISVWLAALHSTEMDRAKGDSTELLRLLHAGQKSASG